MEIDLGIAEKIYLGFDIEEDFFIEEVVRALIEKIERLENMVSNVNEN
jgi:uncharacterized protein (UPF0335 family)